MYGSVAESITYFSTMRLDGQTWLAEPDDRKTQALNMATIAIDRLNFLGEKYDPEQANEFPRDTDDTVPSDIEYACYEIALEFIQGNTPDRLAQNLGSRVRQVSGLRREQDQKTTHEAHVHGIPSVYAWNLLYPYIQRDDTVILSRSD